MRKTSVALAALLLLGVGSGCSKSNDGPSARPSPTPFLTTSVSGLQLWLKADAITGLSDGSSVASWVDSSGNGNPASQATAGLQPTYRTGVTNGWPVVRFNGSQYLASAAIPATGGTSRTVIAVVTNVTVTNSGVKYNHVLHWGAYASPGTADISYGLVVSSNSGQAGGSKMGNHYNLDGHSSAFAAIAGTMLIENSYDGSTDTFYYNGNSGGSKAVTLNTSNGSIVIGARVDHTDEFLTGDIAEILIYSPSISDADRGVVENYLAYKYQIY